MPTLTFGVLYCFFVIDRGRRKILHLNVTRNPNAPWVVLQLRQSWGYDQPQQFLIFDRGAKFNVDVVATAKAMGCRPVRTTVSFKPQREVNVLFSGGEATLSPILFDAIRHAKSMGFHRIHVATNGIEFAKSMDFAFQARAAGCMPCTSSLMGPRKRKIGIATLETAWK